MKKRIIILSGFIAMQCVANDFEGYEDMVDNAMRFATALNLPSTNFVHSPVWTNRLFSSSNIIKTNSYEIRKIDEFSNIVAQSVFAIYSNDIIIAYGSLYECSSFKSACISYIISSMDCSMPPEYFAEDYELLPIGVGDFRLRQKPTLIYPKENLIFVRGGKAIRLGPEPGVDIQPIAETLDALLMSPP